MVCMGASFVRHGMSITQTGRSMTTLVLLNLDVVAQVHRPLRGSGGVRTVMTVRNFGLPKAVHDLKRIKSTGHLNLDEA